MRPAEALAAVDRAIQRERIPVYLVLRPELRKTLNDIPGGERDLLDAMVGFGRPGQQSDWELSCTSAPAGWPTTRPFGWPRRPSRPPSSSPNVAPTLARPS